VKSIWGKSNRKKIVPIPIPCASAPSRSGDAGSPEPVGSGGRKEKRVLGKGYTFLIMEHQSLNQHFEPDRAQDAS